jgi:hypothetical protein
MKKRWKLFGQISIDTKDLKDIPHYWPQMRILKLPKYQFTAREIRSGLMFTGFANEKSASNACLFARILCEHLRNCGVDMKKLKFQTDNGSEFIGCFRQDKSRDGFGATVAGFEASHKRIPPRAWSYNSDVETVHRTIEDEFYDLESFESIKDFHRRVASYQSWYNLVRENSNKDYKSPWQIIRELAPQIDPAIARLPPLMLDWLGPDYIAKEELSLRGYDVPCYPCGLAKEHRIPLIRIRCMTDRRFKELKKLWRGLGGKAPAAKNLKKIGPRNTITVFPRA